MPKNRLKHSKKNPAPAVQKQAYNTRGRRKTAKKTRSQSSRNARHPKSVWNGNWEPTYVNPPRSENFDHVVPPWNAIPNIQQTENDYEVGRWMEGQTFEPSDPMLYETCIKLFKLLQNAIMEKKKADIIKYATLLVSCYGALPNPSNLADAPTLWGEGGGINRPNNNPFNYYLPDNA